MSNSVRPHRQQPTRLLCPWDSPGKNIGVGCHFLLQCMKVKSESTVAQSCPTLSDPMDSSPPGSSVHGIFQARVLEWGFMAFSRWERESGCKEVYNKGGRQSEHQRLLLRKTSYQVKECSTLLCYSHFHVWEDARVWDY